MSNEEKKEYKARTDYNHVAVVGRLVADPMHSQFEDGNHQSVFRLAINRAWNDNDGERQSKATFINCRARGKTAEVSGKYLSKGRKVFVAGYLETAQWHDKKNNIDRAEPRIFVEEVIFMDQKPTDGKNGDSIENNATTESGSFVPNDICPEIPQEEVNF
jgi:single stranded DNA-binding protein